MRLTNKVSHRVIALGLVAVLGACGRFGDSTAVLASTDSGAGQMPVTGPAGDYPVVLGQPYSVDGQLFTPVDTVSYDEVGYAAPDSMGGSGVTAAHKTLPLPSYIEVTSLVTGKTILARVERRGPMTGERLVALSSGAQAQLGSEDGAPVRVRRVNPPEVDRAKLRKGDAAPERMETPQSLIAVLKRKLPARGSADIGLPNVPGGNASSAVSARISTVAVPPMTEAAQAPVSDDPAPITKTETAANAGQFVVQAAAFSNQSNAQKAASALGGYVQPAGKFFRVRVGPFISRGQADAALAKVLAAGYSDAIVSTAG